MMRTVHRKATWSEAPGPGVRSLKSVVLGLLVIVMLYPLAYVVAVSFATSEGLAANPLFPTQFTLDAYRTLLAGAMVPNALWVSVVVTTTGTVLSVFFTTTLAYGLSRTRDVPGSKFFLYLVFFTMLFNAGIIPNYLLVKQLGLLNTLPALVVPTMISAFNLVVIRNFIMELPDEIIEAARMDGAGEVQTFIRVVLPLSKAPIAVIALFYAVNYWNSFFTAMIYISDPGKWPIQLVLNTYVLQDSPMSQLTPNPMATPPPSQSIQMAVVVLATIPILILYPFAQRHFTKGVLTGAIKG